MACNHISTVKCQDCATANERWNFGQWGSQIQVMPDYCDCDQRCEKCGKVKKPYEITWLAANRSFL